MNNTSLNTIKALIITLILFTSSFAYSQVWITENNWDENYEKEFSEWVESDAVKYDMFRNKRSRYYGLFLDCADVTYALRAVFSFENKLPFQTRNPLYSKKYKGSLTKKYWSNELTKFNSTPMGIPRLLKYIKFLAASLGTETLTYYDSYPVQINKLSAGDAFLYKTTDKKGKFQRHSYNIKKVTDTGYLDVLFSNQQRARLDDGRPMKYYKGFQVKHKPTRKRWGYKRMKSPGLYKLSPSEYPHYIHYGTKQYQQAQNLSESSFFAWVRKVVRTRGESVTETIARNFGLICVATKERITDVDKSVEWQKKYNNKCMNYKQYDAFSTPSRDKRLLGIFKTLKSDWDYIKENRLNEVEPEDEEVISLLYETLDWDEEQSEIMHKFCSIHYNQSNGGEESLHLGQIYQGLASKKISSHPNDNIHRRWGVPSGKKTTCKKWY